MSNRKTTCPSCYGEYWDDPDNRYLVCPHCGIKVEHNEYSSEDADEGCFDETNTISS